MTGQGQPPQSGTTARCATALCKGIPVQTAPSQAEARGTGGILLPIGMAVQPAADLLTFSVADVIQGPNTESRRPLHHPPLQLKTDGCARLGMAFEVLKAFNDRAKGTPVCCPLHHQVLRPFEKTVEIAGLGNAVKSNQGARPREGRTPFWGGDGGRHGQESHASLRQSGGRGCLLSGLSSPSAMTEAQSPEWYATWFDSPHYHKLYGHRNAEEASQFVQRLHDRLGWSELRLLDLACGMGRHAAAAARLGHRVTGIDLSPHSIAAARDQHEGVARLNFREGDMRTFEVQGPFDGVLNLFTSFGYFKKPEDHKAVLLQVYKHLKPGGFLVLDFLDVDFAKARLVEKEKVVRGDTIYSIRRQFAPLFSGVHGFIKDITFETEGKSLHFIEQVAGLSREDLARMLHACGFQVSDTFGDYDLQPWKAGASPRVILYATRS
ncbi:MAG: class I SAM-dependent methyltransferase [Crocinitomicaceae bacterium TMED114]|nr:MAG: class I SAM-dependent methyltransferase [Crocinitomicaceae bacterium TMED114]